MEYKKYGPLDYYVNKDEKDTPTDYMFNRVVLEYEPTFNCIEFYGGLRTVSRWDKGSIESPMRHNEVIKDFVKSGFGDSIQNVDLSVLSPHFEDIEYHITEKYTTSSLKDTVIPNDQMRSFGGIPVTTAEELKAAVESVKNGEKTFWGFRINGEAKKKQVLAEFSKLVEGFVGASYSPTFELDKNADPKYPDSFYDFQIKVPNPEDKKYFMTVGYTNQNPQDTETVNAKDLLEKLCLSQEKDKLKSLSVAEEQNTKIQ
jgi:hypothetical protein